MDLHGYIIKQRKKYYFKIIKNTASIQIYKIKLLFKTGAVITYEEYYWFYLHFCQLNTYSLRFISHEIYTMNRNF